MNTKRQSRVPNKARLDNRWGWTFGDAFRSIYPPPVLTINPVAAVPVIERYGN
jgi:hypothetical protein